MIAFLKLILKMKNVLITGEAYETLLELGFTPNQLLAKLPKSKDRVKSPKSNKFIHIYTNTYRQLVKEYGEEEILKRRDGYIKSPTTNQLVKVFSKSFNLLLTSSPLDYLLSLPREKKGENESGITFNNIITLRQQCEKLKHSNYSINKLISQSEIIGVYVGAKLNTYFFFSCAIFKLGQLVEYFEAKETYEDFLYTNKRNEDNIKNFDEYCQFLQDDNENNLTDIKVEGTSLNLNQNVVKTATFNDTLFSICKHHLWLHSNAKILNLLPIHYKHKTALTLLDEENNNREYEEFIEVKEKKVNLIKEMNEIKNLLDEKFSM